MFVNSDISLNEFKFIFYWEYFHRLLGRIIGLVCIIPLIYFFFEYINKKIVVNPLAKVKRDFVNSYFKIHNIERHPLFESGYQSLGCTHCTVKTLKIDSPRSGRWANKIKTECGIHYNLKK